MCFLKRRARFDKRSRHVTLLLVVGLMACLPALEAAQSGRQALTTSHLRVCADPANLPYSNEALEGFENKIIALVASKLELDVSYTWYPQSTGFVRNTLRIRECDLISGITTTSEKVQNTNPYYQSVYSMVYRTDAGLEATQMSDPALSTLKLGVVAGTPPANIIASLGLLGNVRPYQLVADTRRDRPAEQAILDVASGEIDVAFIWGPIAGYNAARSEVPLTVVPLLNEAKHARLAFRVSMAVRYNETEWKRRVNQVLKELKPQIDQILVDYNIPLLNDQGDLIEP